MELNKNQKVICSFLAILAISVIGYYIMQKTSSMEEYTVQSNTIIQAQEQEKIIEVEDNTIILHIAGQVLNEGIVELKEGARVYDAIEEAGGLLEDADLSNINLAYVVSDGQKIYIPSKLEAAEEVLEEDIILENEFEEEIININTASKSELEKLPGIGSITASNIIKYRKENGQFEYIEEIMEISRNRGS